MKDRISEEHDHHDMSKPHRLIDSVKKTHKRRPNWEWDIILYVEKYGAPYMTSIERKSPRNYSSYVALLCDIIDANPSNYEEATERKEWNDVMIEEY